MPLAVEWRRDERWCAVNSLQLMEDQAMAVCLFKGNYFTFKPLAVIRIQRRQILIKFSAAFKDK